MCKEKGIYNKFKVERTDGKSAPGQKHEKCRYFVLDLDHDRHAIEALRGYALSCNSEYPELAKDLHRISRQMENDLYSSME